LQQLIVSHLTFLWDDVFAAEWKRVQRTLLHWTEMYRYSMEPDWMLGELLYTFTGRHVDEVLIAQAGAVQQVTIVPSWHCGWHVVSRPSEDGLLIFFSEPGNYNNAELRKITMGQSELLARLSALGDETRLRIIELLMQRDEWEAQEIIAELDLSQSSVSRHLKQLVALGYLYERRGEGANKTYRLSSFFFERTARAIERLVSGEQFQVRAQPEQELDKEVKRFVDEQGRLTTWPLARQRDKVIVLEYLASFFQPDREYSEKEVNEILLTHSLVQDAAALRRAMTEYHFMQRRRNGAAYWLAGTNTEE
jgi:DNA-binding HxlR family transcriptional regulator